MSFLHVDSIRKSFNGQNVLNDVFISCERGEIIGLLGRNGSGKSTLLKVIFGSLIADNKFVCIDNKKVNSLYSTRNLIRYLPQNSYLPNHKKIKDLISCFCTNADEARKHDLIKDALNKTVYQLSGGEKRIVEILFMVNSEASVLLFDEPFNGIEPNHIEVIREIIKLHSKNKAIIVTDHDYRNVIDIASRLVFIQNGNTKNIRDANELFDLGYLPESEKIRL
jgi:ABC-type multidrug transport system ATPase subunit